MGQSFGIARRSDGILDDTANEAGPDDCADCAAIERADALVHWIPS